MNQGVFWWAGRTGPQGTSRLYQLTHDYLINVQKLTNLIWVWDVQDIDQPEINNAFNPKLYNPGDSYWDILALDAYSDGLYNLKYYNQLMEIVGKKLFVIGECGKLHTPEELDKLNKAVFFMAWSETLKDDNADKAIQNIYYANKVVTLDEMPGWN